MKILWLLVCSVALAQNPEELVKEIQDAIIAADEYVIPEETDFDRNSYTEQEGGEYQYIIVGGGSAGAVLANRLSQDHKTLLIESGGRETSTSVIPFMKDYVAKSDLTWHHFSEPSDKVCLAFKNNSCWLRSGNVLGGTSATGDMIDQIGRNYDYDTWAESYPDWSWEKVIKDLYNLEAAHLQNEDRPAECYNPDGEIWKENPRYGPLSASDIFKAGEELGLTKAVAGCDNDFNHQIGYYRVQIKNGKRQSSAANFLQNPSQNLDISLESQVIKILIDPETSRATGVEYIQGSNLITAKANKEVIVTAGTINTAQILMLSGIGPESIKEHGIEQIVDLPVGQNLKSTLHYFGNKFLLTDREESSTNLEENAKLYLEKNEGPFMAVKGGAEIVAYLNLGETPNRTEVSLTFTSGFKWFNNDDDRLKDDILLNFKNPIQDKPGMGIGVILHHPASTGEIRLKDSDPFHRPIIETKALSEDIDVDRILKAIKWTHDFINTEAAKKLGQFEIFAPEIKGCPDKETDEDGYWRCSIRHFTCPLNRDFLGATRMGSKGEGVVNDRLVVHGIDNLRVCDVNVAPVTITGEYNVLSMVVADRCAKWILEDFNN